MPAPAEREGTTATGRTDRHRPPFVRNQRSPLDSGRRRRSVLGMFPWRRDRKKTGEESQKPTGTKPGRGKLSRQHAAKHGAESYGFTGLEGDFEAERRRAAEATREPAPSYEGEEDKPALPGSAAGWTHP